jgi:hypothetical protein
MDGHAGGTVARYLELWGKGDENVENTGSFEYGGPEGLWM